MAKTFVVVLSLALLWAKAASAGPIPAGYEIPEGTISPDGRYGVLVPKVGEFKDDEDPHNKLVEIASGRVLATLVGDIGWDHMGHGSVQPCRWSKDQSLMLWEVTGKWFPDALVLLKIEKGEVVWQLDLLRAGQQAILERTHEAKPKEYLAAKAANAGNGSAYPDGFSVDVYVKGEAEAPLPATVAFHIDLTSDPKGLRENPLTSQMDGWVTPDGAFIVRSFRLGAAAELRQW